LNRQPPDSPDKTVIDVTLPTLNAGVSGGRPGTPERRASGHHREDVVQARLIDDADDGLLPNGMFAPAAPPVGRR
jgi:hypothetical protein